ncbi:MAG: hypothetical protein KKB59_20125, partial [Spirochaetes bacterium]|nr:hypothetical protein [Spirochaetota bacterium]
VSGNIGSWGGMSSQGFDSQRTNYFAGAGGFGQGGGDRGYGLPSALTDRIKAQMFYRAPHRYAAGDNGQYFLVPDDDTEAEWTHLYGGAFTNYSMVPRGQLSTKLSSHLSGLVPFDLSMPDSPTPSAIAPSPEDEETLQYADAAGSFSPSYYNMNTNTTAEALNAARLKAGQSMARSIWG